MTTPANRYPASDYPATYQVVVLGNLTPSWSRRLEGMSISFITTSDHAVVTTLVGELSDQAALVGVLNSLYELHLPLLSVQRLAGESDAADRIEQ